MSNTVAILALLDDLKPQGQCDDCLSVELDIQPRQTVNQICRTLAAAKKIERIKSQCVRCGSKVKITSIFTTMPAAAATGQKSSSTVLDIEKARTEIVHICRALWKKTNSGEPPRGLAALINGLKNDAILPSHEANMMLTVCGLRNVHVYEGLELQAREMAVAVNARAIIMDWSGKQAGEKR
jgi:hypothetical protein